MSNAQSCAEKIFVNLNSPPAFQLRQKVLGDNNANLTYIINETKASVTLRGRGSGYIEQNGTEANDPLHLLIEHPVLKNLIEAKNYAKNLIETIHSDLQMFLQSNQQTVQIQQQQQPQPPPIIQTVKTLFCFRCLSNFWNIFRAPNKLRFRKLCCRVRLQQSSRTTTCSQRT